MTQSHDGNSWLRQQLRIAGKTQVDLAAALQRHPSVVCRLLSGERTFDLAFIPPIAELLGLPPEEVAANLLTGRPEQTGPSAPREAVAESVRSAALALNAAMRTAHSFGVQIDLGVVVAAGIPNVLVTAGGAQRIPGNAHGA